MAERVGFEPTVPVRKKKMEEEDKKAETNLEIWRKHDEKEGKGLKKIFIFIFLVFVLLYIVKSI